MLQKKVESRTTVINNIATRLDHHDSYSRRNSIRLQGIKVKDKEDTDAVVCNLAERIGVTLTPDDIDR